MSFYLTRLVKSLQIDAPCTALSFHNDGHTIVVGTLYGLFFIQPLLITTLVMQIGGLLVYDLRSGSSVTKELKGHDGTSVNYVDFIRLAPEEAAKVTS